MKTDSIIKLVNGSINVLTAHNNKQTEEFRSISAEHHNFALDQAEIMRNDIGNYIHEVTQWAENHKPQRNRGTRSCKRNVNY